MTDTYTNEIPGVRGQTRSSWRDTSHLRGLLLELIAKNPSATRDELSELYLDATGRDEWIDLDAASFIKEALMRAFDNDFARANERARPPRCDRTASRAAEVTATAARLSTIVWLDHVMLNHKKLRDCSGAELSKMEKRYPAWLQRLRAKIKPSEIVGEVLSETEVRSLGPKDWI